MFPHRDVYDFSKALEELGFRVLSMVDLTLVEMRTMMLAFSKLLGKGVFSVFYFAGHGYEVNGENYLMPIDAKSSEHLDEFLSAQEMLNVRSAFLYIYLLFYIYIYFQLFLPDRILTAQKWLFLLRISSVNVTKSV